MRRDEKVARDKCDNRNKPRRGHETLQQFHDILKDENTVLFTVHRKKRCRD